MANKQNFFRFKWLTFIQKIYKNSLNHFLKPTYSIETNNDNYEYLKKCQTQINQLKEILNKLEKELSICIDKNTLEKKDEIERTEQIKED